MNHQKVFFFFLTCLSERLCGDIVHKGACFWQTVHSWVLSFRNSLSSPRVKYQPSWFLRWKPRHVRPHWRYQGSFIVVLQHRRAQWNVKGATATSHMNVSLVVTKSTSQSLKKKKKKLCKVFKGAVSSMRKDPRWCRRCRLGHGGV